MQDNVKLQKIARTFSSDEDRLALRKHLRLVVESEAFKGSRRSAQFLLYVVEKSLDQQPQALKERTIGIELFGRTPTYDTGEDAIVRVTATDVRRRLFQHYGRSEDEAEFRISLPPGGYIPEIQRSFAHKPVAIPASVHTVETPYETKETPVPVVAVPYPAQVNATEIKWPPVYRSVGRAQLALSLATLTVAIALLLWWRHVPVLAQATQPREVSPWSSIFHSPHPVQVIASDPSIADIQEMSNKQLSLSDYANQKYGCETLASSARSACQAVLGGNKFAEIDAGIIAKIAVLADRNQNEITVRQARAVRLRELRTDDNYVLLGSPRSNPWAGLFSDQMDYQI